MAEGELQREFFKVSSLEIAWPEGRKPRDLFLDVFSKPLPQRMLVIRNVSVLIFAYIRELRHNIYL